MRRRIRILFIMVMIMLLLGTTSVSADSFENVQQVENSLVLSSKLCVLKVGETERITIDLIVLNEPSNVPPGGSPPEEHWELLDDSVCSVELSGGNIADGFDENGPKLDQVADVTAMSVGVTQLVVTRTAPGCQVSTLCNLVVYKQGVLGTPGDITGDAQINARDALEALKHSVGKIQLSSESKTKADLNCDGMINAIDALYMLKIAVNKL